MADSSVMEAEKSFQVQQKIRENADDLQHFMKDLENWEKDMKQKENELKFLKMSEDNEIPPIRNVVAKSKKKRHKKQKDKEKKVQSERISGYNYNAWEKFDVDSELKKLDEDKKESSASNDSEEESEEIIQQRKQLAIIKKDKGNDFFKQGLYDSAINCYTVGMELDPDNPLLPANRAIAFLKKEQYQAAENDCTLCLSIDPTYIKAYLRRATARKALEKFSLAEEDYLNILGLEPGNKSACTELEKLKKVSKVTTNNRNSASSNISSIAENITNVKNDDSPSERLQDMLNSMECPQPFVIPSNSESDVSSLSKSISNKSNGKNSSVQLDDFSEIESVVKQLEQTLPPVPTASYQFLADWRKLSKYPNLQYEYLKQFAPKNLPIIFKHDMEAEIFCGILQILSSAFLINGDDVFPYMKYLTKVGRFHTLLMFLSSKEQLNMKKLVDHLSASKNLSEVQDLLKLYKV